MKYDQIYKRINELCEERGWSYNRLVKESDVAASTFYNMMSRRSIPQVDLIWKICNGFNITLSDFFSDQTQQKELTEKDIALLEITKKLDSKGLDRMIAYGEALVDSMEN